jgi:hypothetical protein
MTTYVNGIAFGDITLQNLSSLVVVPLNNAMQWTDRFASHSVGSSAYRTLGGGLVVFRAGLLNGRTITLSATNEHGWLKWAHLEPLLEWAAISDSNQRFKLTFFTEEYEVVFAHHESPAVDFAPLRAMQLTTDNWFIGSLRLITV